MIFVFYFNRKIHRSYGLTLFGNFIRPRFRLIPLLLDFFVHRVRVRSERNGEDGAFADDRYRLPTRLIERVACPWVLLAPNRRTLFPFERMCSRVHPSDVATRRCTSRVLVTGLLERIVVYPDYLAQPCDHRATERLWESLELRFQG